MTAIARKNVMLGTAGHVDHGKTAVVKILTGCNTDSLAECRVTTGVSAGVILVSAGQKPRSWR
jgi:translation initiation factor 2 gamma subunit (eIF-2gamma)